MLRDRAANGSHLVSLDRCRQLLGSGCKLTDDELNRIREQLYGLANVAVAAVLEAGPLSSVPAAQQDDGRTSIHRRTLLALPADLRDDIEERAAIMEFDGGLGRREAERQALHAALRRRPSGEAKAQNQ